MSGNTRNPTRDARIVALHVDEGLTLTEVAARVRLTPERVRQIVRRSGVPAWVTAEVRHGARKPPPRCAKCGKQVSPRRRRCWDCYVESRRNRRPTDAELLQHLRELSERLGATAGQRDLNAASGPCHTTYYDRFGSLRRAQELAGLTPNTGGGAGAMPYPPNGTGPEGET